MTKQFDRRNAACAHLLLCGWTAYFYTTMFDSVDGWAMWHDEHKCFRANLNGQGVVRNSALPEGAREVMMMEVTAAVFWKIFDRLTRMGLVDDIGVGNPYPHDLDVEDRRDIPK